MLKKWSPPSQCGCLLNIDAEWVDNDNLDISYRHPKPMTITSLSIISVCKDHEAATKQMPDTSIFFDTPSPDSVEAKLAAKYNKPLISVQHRGYKLYPPINQKEPP